MRLDGACVRHAGDVKVDSGLAAAYSSSLVAAMRFRLRSGGSEQVRVNELTGVVVLDTALDRASLCPYADTCTIVVDVVVRPSQVRRYLRPDLQNIFRQSYDYLTIMQKLRSTYNGRLIYKTS